MSRVAAVGAVGFLAGAYELDVHAGGPELRGSEVFIHRNLHPGAEKGGACTGQGDSVPEADNGDVLGFAPQDLIAHKSPNGKAIHAQVFSGTGHGLQGLLFFGSKMQQHGAK